MVFDTDLLRVARAWTGGFLKWLPARHSLQEWPTPDGFTHFSTGPRPGWSRNGKFADPRRAPLRTGAGHDRPLPGSLPARRSRGFFLPDRRRRGARVSGIRTARNTAGFYANVQCRCHQRIALAAGRRGARWAGQRTRNAARDSGQRLRRDPLRRSNARDRFSRTARGSDLAARASAADP